MTFSISNTRGNMNMEECSLYTLVHNINTNPSFGLVRKPCVRWWQKYFDRVKKLGRTNLAWENCAGCMGYSTRFSAQRGLCAHVPPYFWKVSKLCSMEHRTARTEFGYLPEVRRQLGTNNRCSLKVLRQPNS
jgi:hypothetical protein